jgi:hypothetical protein
MTSGRQKRPNANDRIWKVPRPFGTKVWGNPRLKIVTTSVSHARHVASEGRTRGYRYVLRLPAFLPISSCILVKVLGRIAITSSSSHLLTLTCLPSQHTLACQSPMWISGRSCSRGKTSLMRMTKVCSHAIGFGRRVQG